MGIPYARNKGRKVTISGPRIPEYFEKSGERLRELSAHLDKAMNTSPLNNGNGSKK